MPDMISPVGLGSKPPDLGQGIGLLSNIIGLQQQKQNLQTGAYSQQTAQAGATVAQQNAKENQAIAALLQDPVKNGITDADGNPLPGAGQKLAQAAPTTWATKAQQIYDAAKSKIDFQNSLNSLTESKRAAIGADLSAAAAGNLTAPQTRDMITQHIKANPGLADAGGIMIQNLPDQPHLTGDPKVDTQMLAEHRAKLSQYQTAMGRSVMGAAAAGGLNTVSTTPVNAGGSIPLVQTTPGGGVGTSGVITPTPPPGFTLTTDPRSQNQYLINQQTGEVRPLGAGAPGANGKASPPGNAPPQLYPGAPEDIRNYQTEVANTRTAGDQAPLARNINQQILRLSKGGAGTGPGSDVWQHAIGAVGAPLGLSPTASYQEVGKYLEKNAINNMQAMGGPPSDQRLSASMAANGGPSFSPTALQDVTKFNDATTTGLAQYRQGMDNAVGMGKNTNYMGLPAFKSDWAKNFDVNIFRVENAIRDNDSDELTKITKELGPKGLQALAIKRRNLQSLTQTGQLPAAAGGSQ